MGIRTNAVDVAKPEIVSSRCCHFSFKLWHSISVGTRLQMPTLSVKVQTQFEITLLLNKRSEYLPRTIVLEMPDIVKTNNDVVLR
jgi:hypothetical protein